MSTTKVSDLLDSCMDGDLEKTKQLVDEIGDVNCDVSGRSPLLHAAYGGHTEVMRYLVGKGARIDRQLDTGATPLHYACQGGHVEAVRYLVNECKANLELRDINGRTALLNTAYLGNNEILGILIDGGADPHVQDKGGFNSISTACEGGLKDTVEFFLAKGAKLGVPGWNGNNELHLAAANGFWNIVELLKTKGSDTTACNYYGYTPAQLAMVTLVDDKARYLNEVLQKLGVPEGERPSLPHRVTIEEFITEGRPVMPNLGLNNVLVITKEILFEVGQMPHYSVCEENGWHKAVEDLPKGSKILFVSHRWGSVDFPDPGEKQYRIVEEYLRSDAGKEIEYIWLDYASICQEKGSEKFFNHLQNIPTAVWCSSRCLIIPQVVDVDRAYEEGSCEITDLADYVGRAWCLFEAMAALLTGTDVTCAFQLGGKTTMMPFTRPEGASSSMGFFQAFVDVSHELLGANNRDWQYVGQDNLNTKWQVEEPCGVLGLLMKIVRDETTYGFILSMARTLEVGLEDVENEHAGQELKDLWNLMGQCSFDEDKIVVLNLMLFVGIYSIKSGTPSGTPRSTIELDAIQATDTSPSLVSEQEQEKAKALIKPSEDAVVSSVPQEAHSPAVPQEAQSSAVVKSKEGCGCLLM